MINVFNTEDFEKYPQLHIAIIRLVNDWVNQQLKRELNIKKRFDKAKALYKKHNKNELIQSVVEANFERSLLALLVEDILYHLIKHGDPQKYSEIIEILKSENELEIKKEYNLSTLLSIYLNITKIRIDDSIRMRKFRRSPPGRKELFERAYKILEENKRNKYKCTQKNAITLANEELRTIPDDLIRDKIYLEKLVGSYKQFDQKKANKKIQRVNRITKG